MKQYVMTPLITVGNLVGIMRLPNVGGTEETVQQTLAKSCYMWKTQPPKPPLSGGLVTQFPPDKGG